MSCGNLEIDFNDPQWQIPQSIVDALNEAPEPVTLAALTEQVVGGSGVFDGLMTALRAHLKVEMQANRITGAEYVKAYIALTEAAMTNAVQFLINRDQARWKGIEAQLGAFAARVNLYKTQVEFCTSKEQMEATRAQTMDTRSDGITPIAGAIGVQKELQLQQKESYIKDAELKAAQMWQSWLTSRFAIIEDSSPSAMSDVSIQSVMAKIATDHLGVTVEA